MNYLCPKCKNLMTLVTVTTIPAINYYWCWNCGYKSKEEKEPVEYATLPKCLWSDDEMEGEQE